MIVRRAVCNYFDKRKTFLLHLNLECPFKSSLGLIYVSGIIAADTFDISGAGQSCEHFAHMNGVAVNLRISTVNTGSCLFAGHGGRSHLSAGHTVNTVIDEYNSDVLASHASVNGLCHTYRSKVAVALISKYDIVGIHYSANCACGSGSSAVSCLKHVAFKIFISEYCASYGNNADSAVNFSELFQNLSYKFVNDAVSTSRAIMQRSIGEHLRLFVNYFHYYFASLINLTRSDGIIT